MTLFGLVLTALGLTIQPVVLVGCLGAGVVARGVGHALAYAAVWALIVQGFVVLVEGSFLNPVALGAEFAIRLVGIVAVTLLIFALDRLLRHRGNGPGRRPPRHLRRVK